MTTRGKWSRKQKRNATRGRIIGIKESEVDLVAGPKVVEHKALKMPHRAKELLKAENLETQNVECRCCYSGGSSRCAAVDDMHWSLT